MKTNFLKKLMVLTVIVTFSNFMAKSQTTYLSGTGTNNCGTIAGVTGTNSTYVGCGAGNGSGGGNGGAVRNTFIGSFAGYNTTAFGDNVGIGFRALYTLSSQGVLDSTFNVAVGNYALFTNNPTTNPATNGMRNTAMGHRALFSNTTANNNTAVGFQALRFAAGAADSNNVAVGYRALANLNGTSGGGLTAVGSEALLTTTNSSSRSTAVGYHALRLNTGKGPCTAVGSNALNDNDGSENTAVGSDASLFNPAGNYNCTFGVSAGKGVTGNSYSSNSFFGYQSGMGITTGGYNTFAGGQSGLANTIGANNTFSGYQSGYTNTTGQDNTFSGYQSGKVNTASYNTFSGSLSGVANTTGHDNVFSGYQSGNANTTGFFNTFVGTESGSSNTTARSNTFIGYRSGKATTTAHYNTFSGAYSGLINTTGYYNTFSGYQSGNANTTASYNTYFGSKAGYMNTTGYGNTAIGYQAGDSHNNDTLCTFVGYGADANGNYKNATAIGNGTIATQSNSVELGNASVTLVHGPVPYTWSDGRFKFNINENVKGLEFINKLRPITYQMNTQQLDNFIIQNMPDSAKTMHQEGMDFAPSTSMIHSGFLAQEVDSAAQASDFISSIVHRPANSTDSYSLSYAEFVVPLVKAVQELSNKYDSLLALTSPTGTRMMNNNSNGQGRGFNEDNTLELELANNNQTILYQNEPNPFGENTTIRYFIPENTKGTAFIVFYDMYGKEIKRAELITKGFGNINANTENLASGIYSYSLIINNNVIDTKKMMRNK